MSGAAGTGGHAGHARNSALACSACHGSGFSTTTVTYPGHVDNKINLHFTDPGTGTVYTNSSTMDPGTAYGTCSVSLCHGSLVTAAWGVTSANPKCGKCHGYRSAPWNALNGDVNPVNTTAGTHFSHISSSGAIKYARPFSCAECHASSISLATQSVTSAGHFDSPLPAEVVFGALAGTGTTPTISIPNPANPSGVQCSNVYCHGATLTPSVPPRTDPVWNSPFFNPDGGSSNCSFCHGYPPATSIHTGQTNCKACHSHVNATNNGFSDATKHVDGIIEASSGAHSFPYPGGPSECGKRNHSRYDLQLP
jgi:predicted CxxxxCH...CXXCH cytochrome family protein